MNFGRLSGLKLAQGQHSKGHGMKALTKKIKKKKFTAFTKKICY